MRIKIFFLVLIQLMIISCKNNDFYKSYDFPFSQKQKNNMPLVEVQIKGKTYIFGIDTGLYEPLIFFESGINKYFSSQTEYETKKNKYLEKKKNNEISQEYNFKIPLLKIQNLKIREITVYCFDIQNESMNGIDGIIGLSLLQRYKTITIDYNQHKILLNNQLINTNCILPFKISREYKIQIPVRLNYNKQFALIDTGLDSNNNKYILIHDKMNANKLFKINEAKYGDAYIYEIKIEIDNLINEQIWGIKTSELPNSFEFVFGDYAKKFTQDKNILGNAVFEGHIIQFDFENMEFRIQ